MSTLSLTGSLTTGSSYGGCTGSSEPSIAIILDETLLIDGVPMLGEYALTSDSAQVVSLGNLTGVHAIFLKATGGKVRARLTSADGATQAVPVDPVFFVISEAVPFTALDLTRETGVLVTVQVLLAKKTP